MKFGPFSISPSEVFYSTSKSFALVNVKPITPGHVLIIPHRIVKRFTDLTPIEVTDLFNTGHVVAKQIEKEYQATSLTITIQDGVDAGQSVPHVHVHIIPRRKGDYVCNDDIYNDILIKERELLKEYQRGVDNEERKPRTREEMGQEASRLRQLFQGMNPNSQGID